MDLSVSVSSFGVILNSNKHAIPASRICGIDSSSHVRIEEERIRDWEEEGGGGREEMEEEVGIEREEELKVMGRTEEGGRTVDDREGMLCSTWGGFALWWGENWMVRGVRLEGRSNFYKLLCFEFSERPGELIWRQVG